MFHMGMPRKGGRAAQPEDAADVRCTGVVRPGIIQRGACERSVRPGRGIKGAAWGISVKLNFFTSFHFLK